MGRARRRGMTGAFVLVALLAWAGVGTADEGGTSTAAPVDAPARAKIGDWAAYEVRQLASLGRSSTSRRVTRRWTVRETEKDRIRIRVAGREDDGEARAAEHTLPTDGSLSIEDLLRRRVLVEVKTSRATYDVRGKRFSCTRVDALGRDDLIPEHRIEITAWLSDEVPSGVVAVLVRDRMERSTGVIEIATWEEVSGIGDASGTRWGADPGE